MRTKQTQQLNNLLSHWDDTGDDRIFEESLSVNLKKFHIHW